MDIPEFPTFCQLMIEDANNRADVVSGAGFTMVSTKGVASTYALQATVAGASATETAGSGSSTAVSNLSTGTASMTASPTGSSAAQTEVASTSSGALSPGAKGGLAIGIIVAVLAVLAGVFFFFRRSRRQMQRLDSTARASPTEKAAAAATTAAAATDLRQTNLQTNEPGSGPETIVTPTFQSEPNNRNSEDWRRFFGSAAVSRRGTPATS